MIAVRGISSRIAQELAEMVEDEFLDVSRGQVMPTIADRFLFCQGEMWPARIGDQQPEQVASEFWVNAAWIIRECDRLIAVHDSARICVIGSESAFTWSHDGSYAAAKAALHRYIETKAMRTPWQQLVCVAPGIIGDCAMTTRRGAQDAELLDRRRAAHRMKRFLTAREVAALVKHLLYVDAGYLSGIVIRMNGGQHCQAA